MKNSQTVARQGFSLRQMMLMIPVVAGMANPGLVANATNALQSNATALQMTASSFTPPVFAGGYGGGGNGALYVTGGPIYLPHG